VTTRPLINLVPELAYETPQIGRTVRGPDLYNVAVATNVVALARPFRAFHIANVSPGTYVTSYRRTHDAIHQAHIEWTTRLTMPDGTVLAAGETLTVTLTITDAAGHSVASSSSMIPAGFKGESFECVQWPGDPAVYTIGGAGWLDLDALAATLTDPSWSFSFVVARPTGSTSRVDSIALRELGRTVVDTSDAYGVDPADFQPGQPAGAGSSTTGGTLRLAQTIEGGIAAQPDVLSLVWINDITATIPRTTSSTYAAMLYLEQSSGVSMRFRVPVRPIYYALADGGTTAGERARWRVRYYVTGGGTGAVQILTGATASPYSITGLTGAAWAWSAWQDCELPTSGASAIATLSFKAQVSGGTLYVAAIHVQSY
jgi:hypothetical protein